LNDRADTAPKFTIVTPSRNMLGYLERCAASIADQQPSVQHIVMDACSDDGTGTWLASRADIESVVAPDDGMYDALNKGFARARGEIYGYLNCDEQYLPGTLARVQAFFERHPGCDMLFGGCLLVRPDGSLIAFRKAYPPVWPLIATSHLYVLSCTMFFRRRVWDRGLRFDASLRDIADFKFVVDAMRAGVRADILPGYSSAFTMTGHNMSAGDNAARETTRYVAALSPWLRRMRLPLNAVRLLSKLRHGAYFERFPLRYALHVDGASGRHEFCAASGSFRWRGQ